MFRYITPFITFVQHSAARADSIIQKISRDNEAIQQQLKEITQSIETEKFETLAIQSAISLAVVVIAGYFTIRQVRTTVKSESVIKLRDTLREKVSAFLGELSEHVGLINELDTTNNTIRALKEGKSDINPPDIDTVRDNLKQSRHRFMKLRFEIELLLDGYNPLQDQLMKSIEAATIDVAKLAIGTIDGFPERHYKDIVEDARLVILDGTIASGTF